ncbi:FAD-binding oxidoreductase [Aurantimonas sp. MSK8Z-1]|uniref:NAD(P)/FAD-dependent oxidoreductase n=1 Tax=Mangrovibrevibacter kandeliae TaxID=2968473 RepID=UPI00211927B7|nr:FAD-binding oxidoreductase [Aurantimonas sp. MSK8Z-1]MCW4115903.1 FAD-binding oxidoreductase [Aurantimonas sp. MSK8Z-1]
MKADVVVLGAGIVGVSTALHLQALGRDVALVDRGQPGEGTSYGNAGLIERSSVVPYAFPRSVTTLLRYALNRSSDVRYESRDLLGAVPFLLRYWRQSSPRNLRAATRAMLPLIEASVSEHEAFIEAAGAGDLVRADGWIAAYRTPRRFQAAIAETAALAPYGLRLALLDGAAVSALEPSMTTGEDGIHGAVHWLDPKTVRDPGELTKRYARLFERRGGRILVGDAATLAETSRSWSVESAHGEVRARDVVVALGPQAGLVFRRLGYRIPLGIKRGYHRHFALPEGVQLHHAMVDEEAGYVLAPMRQGVRLTTGIEFARADRPADARQIAHAERRARQLLPLGEPVESTPWLGRRPCLPDMRPVIGAAHRHGGLWFNFGHAHHGLTIGPASGRLVAELVTGSPPFVDPSPYRADRFG